MKVKLNTKCFFCKDGIINNRDIDHIINRHQNKCTNCSKKLLSEKMTKQNKEWWKNEEYRNKIIENARSRTKNKK